MSRPRSELPKSLARLRSERAWPEGVPIPPAGPFRGNARWTRDEEALLRRYYPMYGAHYAARLLGRSLMAVAARASHLRITRPSPIAGQPRPWARKGWTPAPWTDEDDERLRRLHAEGLTPRQIASKLGRTKKEVRDRSRATGVYRDMKSWGAEEDHLLRSRYGTLPLAAIAGRLGRTTTAVAGRVAWLKIARSRTWAPWSEEDDEQLRELFGTVPHAELGRLMNRSEDAITIRAGKLGLTRGSAVWTPEDEAELARLHAEGRSYDEIAREIGRTTMAVSAHVTKMGLAVTQPQRVRWSAEDEADLRNRYGTISNRELAAELGRTVASVMLKARELGVVSEPSRPWSQEEDRYIREHYESKKMTRRQIAEALGRSLPALASRAGYLGVSRRRSGGLSGTPPES